MIDTSTLWNWIILSGAGTCCRGVHVHQHAWLMTGAPWPQRQDGGCWPVEARARKEPSPEVVLVKEPPLAAGRRALSSSPAPLDQQVRRLAAAARQGHRRCPVAGTVAARLGKLLLVASRRRTQTTLPDMSSYMYYNHVYNRYEVMQIYHIYTTI